MAREPHIALPRKTLHKSSGSSNYNFLYNKANTWLIIADINPITIAAQGCELSQAPEIATSPEIIPQDTIKNYFLYNL